MPSDQDSLKNLASQIESLYGSKSIAKGKIAEALPPWSVRNAAMSASRLNGTSAVPDIKARVKPRPLSGMLIELLQRLGKHTEELMPRTGGPEGRNPVLYP